MTISASRMSGHPGYLFASCPCAYIRSMPAHLQPQQSCHDATPALGAMRTAPHGTPLPKRTHTSPTVLGQVGPSYHLRLPTSRNVRLRYRPRNDALASVRVPASDSRRTRSGKLHQSSVVVVVESVEVGPVAPPTRATAMTPSPPPYPNFKPAAPPQAPYQTYHCPRPSCNTHTS